MDQQERIVSKAHELFMRYGIRSVSMDEIASNLGISKKTIYQFFTDKDALVEAVVTMELSGSEDDCLKYIENSENPVHEFVMALDMIRDMLRLMNPMLIYDMQKYHPSAFQKLNCYQNEFVYNQIESNLNRGVEEELYRPDINVPILARFRLVSVFALFNPDMFPAGKHTLDEIIREITMNFLYGIVTPKGLKLLNKYNQQREKQIQHDEKGK
jgi:AcrR family transcriptional regulator